MRSHKRPRIIKRRARKKPKRVLDIISKRLQYQIPAQFIKTKFGYEFEQVIENSKKIIELERETNEILFQEIGLSPKTDIQVSSLKPVGHNQIGFIPLDQLANHGILFFRTNSPLTNDLLFNIILLKYPILANEPDNEIFNTKKTEILEHFSENVEVTNILKNNGNLEGVDFRKITEVVNLISNFMEFNVLIINNSAKASHMTKLIGAEYSGVISEIPNKNLAILYIYVRNGVYSYEPITGFNKNDKTKALIIPQDNERVLKYIRDLLSEKILNTSLKPRIKPKKRKSIIPRKKAAEKIYFNPYDKNAELPIIELNINGSKTKFLLGHKIHDYHIIYEDDKQDNSIAGKVNLDSSTKTCQVAWCQGFPR